MRFFYGIVAVSLTFGAAILCAKSLAGAPVKQVAPKFVCMADKKTFDEPQKLVVIDNRTYYACSESSEAQLLHDPASRRDVDPLSGKEVDKATATVGVDQAGHVYFFENNKNLKQFRVPSEAAAAHPLYTTRPAHPRR